MMKEDTIIRLDDNKEYYVLQSIMKNSNNFVMIGEIDSIKDEITNNVKIMYYDIINKKVRKVTDPTLLYELVIAFADNVLEN